MNAKPIDPYNAIELMPPFALSEIGLRHLPKGYLKLLDPALLKHFKISLYEGVSGLPIAVETAKQILDANNRGLFVGRSYEQFREIAAQLMATIERGED
jgi:hypothetical protein